MLKSYNFWIRLVAVLVLLLRIIGAEFGLSIDSGLIIDLATAIASVLVVLGVIQVPVENSIITNDGTKNNGGENMNFYEKIKDDITIAKDKLIQNFENNTTALEIVGLLDKVLGTSFIESVEEVKDETIAVEIAEQIPTDEEKVLEEFKPVEDSEEVNNVEDESEIPEVQDETEIVSTTQVESVETIEKEAEISNETQAKLNELLKAKIREVLERDLDEIIAQIS